LDRAKKVVEDLSEAENAQKQAESAIEKANEDIATAENDLTQVKKLVITK
jgi:F0F1-type ATP synthase membrane subunit b/b'